MVHSTRWLFISFLECHLPFLLLQIAGLQVCRSPRNIDRLGPCAGLPLHRLPACPGLPCVFLSVYPMLAFKFPNRIHPVINTCKNLNHAFIVRLTAKFPTKGTSQSLITPPQSSMNEFFLFFDSVCTFNKSDSFSPALLFCFCLAFITQT